MGFPEILVGIYLSFFLLAVIDATIAKFGRWYHQLGRLLAIFLVPGFGAIGCLLFGRRQAVRGGLGFLRQACKEPT